MYIRVVGGLYFGEAMVKVIIADDHPLIRLGMCKLLEKLPDIQVVAEAANGQEALDLVEKHHPDVLLLDLQMPVMDGIEVLDHLQKHGTNVRILIISAYNDKEIVSEVLARGAWAYYVKDDAPTMIVEAVRQAARGDGRAANPRPNAKLIAGLAGAD